MKPEAGKPAVALVDLIDHKGDVLVEKGKVVSCVGLMDLPDGTLAALHIGAGHTLYTPEDNIALYEDMLVPEVGLED